MKKVYIKAYFNDNLGDDLFIKMLTEKYNNVKYTTVLNRSIKNTFENKIKMYKPSRNNLFLNKLIKVVTLKTSSLENHIMNKNDIIVLIGGSMFIEKQYFSKKYYLGNNKPYFILGSNFGPYKTTEYYNKFHRIFSKANDVCFREKHSYNLFEDLKNTRYTCDMVFGLDTSSVKITNNKKVIISVIDCEIKQNMKNKDKYEKMIVSLIKKFYELDYSIVLMSFCKNEGDEVAIKRILSKIKSKKMKNKIEQYNYEGNAKEALDILGDSQIIVGSRFHANIIGLILKKTILPIAYSDKTINTLKDINYKGKIIDIRKLEDFNVDDITEKDLNYKINIDKYRKEAKKHFEKLDKVLK